MVNRRRHLLTNCFTQEEDRPPHGCADHTGASPLGATPIQCARKDPGRRDTGVSGVRPRPVTPDARGRQAISSCSLWRIVALQRLGASCFSFFAACFVAPSHCLPRGSGTASYRFKATLGKGANVRFGSKADICAATSHVRFTPNSDRESEIPQKARSALPPKGCMCSALGDVRFEPKADSCTAANYIAIRRPRRRW